MSYFTLFLRKMKFCAISIVQYLHLYFREGECMFPWPNVCSHGPLYVPTPHCMFPWPNVRSHAQLYHYNRKVPIHKLILILITGWHKLCHNRNNAWNVTNVRKWISKHFFYPVEFKNWLIQPSMTKPLIWIYVQYLILF